MNTILKLVLLSFVFTIHTTYAQNSKIIDHTCTDVSKIPNEYIDLVKQMHLNYIGKSHGRGLMYGLELLAKEDNKFAVSLTWEGEPEAPGDNKLRICYSFRNEANTGWWNSGGEEHFWTSDDARKLILNNLTYASESGYKFDALAFGWCWDMSYAWNAYPFGDNPDSCFTIDETFNTRWYGQALVLNPGAEGQQAWWGIDANDNYDGKHPISLQDYFHSVDYYNEQAPDTKTFFTTGPPDYKGERGYNRFIKNEAIRNYLKGTKNEAYLFDYADIVSHFSDGTPNYQQFDGKNFLTIIPDFDKEFDGGKGSCHISDEACLKLAKAMWWLLARSAGWNEGSEPSSIPQSKNNDILIKSYNNHISISSKKSTINKVEVYSIGGKLIRSIKNNNSIVEFSVPSEWNSIKILKIYSDNKIICKQIAL